VQPSSTLAAPTTRPVGASALQNNVEGANNTAIGYQALLNSVTNGNTATGFQALQNTTTGDLNTATGNAALSHNTTGRINTATGFQALNANTNGLQNTAIGTSALIANTAGNANTAAGSLALSNNTSGSANVALGLEAGSNVTTASNVIVLGADVPGANVSDTTWIGNVFGVTPQSGTTAAVVVSDGGQLGTVASSERFKKDIVTMENASEAILALRPVTFHYKSDLKETPQFGLIAEEVAKVNPTLVLPDKAGKPYTVRYDAVNAMLLNEFLKEQFKN
jgi:hypothetical protein